MDAVDQILAQWNAARPDLNVRAMGPLGRFKRVAQIFNREMSVTFEKYGLNAAGFDVLATLRRTPPHALSAGELMSSMMITSGTMTNRIDQLAKSGLVRRTADPKDARKAVVQLTEAGRSLIDQAVSEHVKTQAGLLARLEEEEISTLDQILRKLLSEEKPASEE